MKKKSNVSSNTAVEGSNNGQDVGLQRSANTGTKKLGGITGKGFVPGRSGNPSGKRKGQLSLTAAIKRVLAKNNNIDKLAASMVVAAAKGDATMAKAILDRVDGTVAAQLKASLDAQLSGTIATPVIVPTAVQIIIPDNHRGDYPAPMVESIGDLPAPAIDVSTAPMLPPAARQDTPTPASAPEPEHVGAPETTPSRQPTAKLRPEEDPSSPLYVPACSRQGNRSPGRHLR